MNITSSHSKEFFELIKRIGESKSKQEEDKVIIKELGTLKSRLKDNVSLKKLKELVIRMLYCEMLGHQADFAYIHAVNLTSSRNIIEKRVGYLAASLCLGPEHDLLLLMVNRLQTDLKSSNYLEVCAALTAAAKLVNRETIPAVLPRVLPLLEHSNANVRKKAVMVLHTFEKIMPGCEADIVQYARKAFVDPDPAVMGASLSLIYDLVQNDPAKYKYLTAGLVNILKQITEHRLSRDFDYHRMPAPWIQVKLLKILSFLGADDEETSKEIYEVLNEALKRADYGLNIGYAVQYECVKTITSIYPNSSLLESAAECISRFIRSESNNLKYLGLTGLASIVKINPKYAIPHQMVVIDCLEDPDETLKRKTLELLYTMTNQANADVIVDRLVKFLRNETSIDSYLRSELVNKIIDLAIRYSRSITWYIEIMNKVFELGPSYVNPEAVHNMLRVIQNEDEDDQIRSFCVETYAAMAENTVLPDVLIQVISWVLGEYGHLSREYTPEQLIDRLCDLTERKHENETTRSWLISALMKLVSGLGYFPDSVNDILDNFKNSKNVDLQQRCYEFLGLRDRMFLLSQVLPPGVGDEELEIDEDMVFLDTIVDEALAQGAADYSPPDEVEYEKETEEASLRIEQYQRPASSIEEKYSNIIDKMHTEQSAPSGMGIVNEGNESLSPETFSEPKLSGGSVQLQSSNAAWSLEGYQPNVKTETAYDRAFKESMQKDNSQSSETTSETRYSAEVPSPSQPFGSQSKQDREPVVDPRKKILAQSIFGAVDDEGANVSTSPRIKRKRRTRRKERGSASVPSSPAIADDMLSLGGSSATSEGKAVSTNDGTSNDLEDLLSGMSISNTPPSTSSPAPQLQPQSNSALKPSDPLGDLFSSLEPASEQEISLQGAQPPLLQRLKGIPTAYPAEQALCHDERLSISYNKYREADHVKCVLFITAARGYALSNIEVQLQAPAKFDVQFNGEPNPQVRGNCASIGSVAPGRAATLVVEMKPTEPGFGTNLMGRISYSDEQRQSRFLSFSTSLVLSDVIRPNKITVGEYAKLWKNRKQFGHEQKQDFADPSVSNVQEFVEVLTNQLNMHKVDVKNLEVLSSGRLVTGEVVIMYAKVSRKMFNLRVKSSNKNLTGFVVSQVAQVVRSGHQFQ